MINDFKGTEDLPIVIVCFTYDRRTESELITALYDEGQYPEDLFLLHGYTSERSLSATKGKHCSPTLK